MSVLTIVVTASLYLCLLFAVAYYVDTRGRGGLLKRAGGWVYALSIAVYCTAWTFYGSVGRAAAGGIGFLAVYLGPILVFVFGLHLLTKIRRIAAAQHTTSIADFVSARYGKSQGLAGLVTVIAVVGIMPYISLQLLAVSTSFDILAHYPALTRAPPAQDALWSDTALWIALLMALFVILFGTRHVDATEQHRGMVTAVALESLVKLGAFVVVGIYITWGMFDGPVDLFEQAAARPAIAPLLAFGDQVWSVSFWMLIALSSAAIVCLPRQFQVTIIEDTDEQHLRVARWVFPAYLVAINVFVLPIALAGLIVFGGQDVSPDTFVLTLPIAAGNQTLAMLAFIGGLSAATGMIIVETIALATMICNDLVMPILIRGKLVRVDADANIGAMVKRIRRIAIVFVLLLGYLYVRLVGSSYALVSIGLVSFCAAAQFAPAIVGAIFWKGGTRSGALAGLGAGFATWFYTLLLPSFAQSGWLPSAFIEQGLFQLDALRPYALFGLTGLDPISHSLFWSMVFNVGAYVLFSRGSRATVLEKSQALAFVDVFAERGAAPTRVWDADVRNGQLMNLVERFVDADRARQVWKDYAASRRQRLHPAARADHEFVDFAEHLLAGSIGSALARVVVASAIHEREMSLDGVMELLTGASQAIEINWERTREAVENIDQGISMFDADKRLIVWNRRCLELLDLPESMVAVGTPLEAVLRYNAQRGEYGPGDVEEQVAARLALADKNQPHLIERMRPDGTVIEVSGKPLPDGGFVTTYTDITERKRAEDALRAAYDEMEQRVAERTRDLRASEERFRDLAETASDWFWEMDSELRFTYLSDRFFELSEVNPASMIGKHRWDMVSPEEKARDPEKWRRHREDIEAHRPVRNFEYEIRSSDGRITHVQVSGRPRFDEQGNFLGYRGTGTNVTELVRAQDELLHTEKLAALGGLVAGVAHEINTPVGIGLTAASFLDERVREFQRIYAEGRVKRSDIESLLDACSEVSTSLLTNLRRAADLVRSFKQVAVDQSSELKRRFNLRAYLDEILLSLHPKLKRTQHQIVVDCRDDLELDSYPGAFSQIITNLVMNSLIHGFEVMEKGNINIEAATRDRELTMVYRDNGKGMTAEQMKHLFEPFYTTRRVEGGSGLGMHVVYNLVTQTLGGRIDARSQPGQGVEFTLRIPIDEEAEHDHQA